MPGRSKAGSAGTASQAASLALPKKIETAAANGKAGVVQTWLVGDGQVDATCVRRGVSGCTLLLIAAGHGHKQLVEVLLKRGAKVTAQNRRHGAMQERTSAKVSAAAVSGKVQVVETLLMHGADRHHKNKQERMPIDLCQPIWSNAWRYTKEVLSQ